MTFTAAKVVYPESVADIQAVRAPATAARASAHLPGYTASPRTQVMPCAEQMPL
jgi:hypothetical protein